MGGAVQDAYVVMRLDLSEIACTPAIGSWTLTTRGTIFKWQSQESWTNSIRPRKCNDWNKSTIPEKNAHTLLPQSQSIQKRKLGDIISRSYLPGKSCPIDTQSTTIRIIGKFLCAPQSCQSLDIFDGGVNSNSTACQREINMCIFVWPDFHQLNGLKY